MYMSVVVVLSGVTRYCVADVVDVAVAVMLVATMEIGPQRKSLLRQWLRNPKH